MSGSVSFARVNISAKLRSARPKELASRGEAGDFLVFVTQPAAGGGA